MPKNNGCGVVCAFIMRLFLICQTVLVISCSQAREDTEKIEKSQSEIHEIQIETANSDTADADSSNHLTAVATEQTTDKTVTIEADDKHVNDSTVLPDDLQNTSDSQMLAQPGDNIEKLKQAAEANPENAQNTIQYITALLDTNHPEEVRRFYRGLPYSVRALPEIRTLYYRAFNEDEMFTQNVETLSSAQIDEISPLGGGTTLTFKFIKNGEKVGAFKPHQKRRNSNYRSEIAAYRLCELLQCDFDIPRNRMVRVEKKEFNKLYNRSKSSKKNTIVMDFPT